MKPSELVEKLKPFCKDNPEDEPTVLIAQVPNSFMPTKPDTVKVWEINKGPNGFPFILIFADPNK